MANKSNFDKLMFPSSTRLNNRMRKRRASFLDLPVEPSSINFEVPEKLKFCTNGESFLLADSGKDDENRILIFGKPQPEECIRRVTRIHIDGTFSWRPK